MKDTNEQLKLSIQSFGFSEKETIVYIALLELGKGTVRQISSKAGINRTTSYDILGSLTNKGLVTISGKEPKSEYIAEAPIAIMVYLKKVAEQTANYIKKSKTIIPELELLHAKQNRPRIRFYEGIDGLEHVYEDTLTSTEPIRAYASVEHMNAGLPGYFPEYFKRRANRGIHIRGIGPRTEANIELEKRNVVEMRETALVPKDKFDFVPEINIYDNKVMIASWREQLGIIIESTEIADAMKVIYELAWAEAKKLEKASSIGLWPKENKGKN